MKQCVRCVCVVVLSTTIDFLMELAIDDSVNGDAVRDAVMAVRDAVMVEVGSIHDENREEESSAEPTYKQDQDDNVTQDSSGGALTIPSAIPTLPDASADEPYVGQEFESEAAAHAFYNAYAAEFVKEHTHPLNPGSNRRDCMFEQYPSQNEHDKIRELSQQLAIEKKRSVTYKRQLEVIFDYIEEHNVTLSHKIQHIVDSVKQMEPKEEEEDNH
ncbi:hypothetical protein P8452_32460 [Trifolium repens]|nr:hypothetical protein P8452_32460 [Trifolium repens]